MQRRSFDFGKNFIDDEVGNYIDPSLGFAVLIQSLNISDTVGYLQRLHSNLAIPELAIPDPLLYRTDYAKICQSEQFRRGSFLL